MKEVIYELIVSAVVLSLVLLSIGLVRKDVEIVKNLMSRSDELEKISKIDFLNIDKDLVIGGDVISFIRYYSNDSDVTVEVNVGGSIKKYITDTYDSKDFKISYDSQFENQIIYENAQIKKIICIEK